MIVNKIEDLIGNTPLIKLDSLSLGLINTDIYVKLEHLNPFGSVKDRTAIGLLTEKDGSINLSDKTLVESSSGNTAKALQVLATRNCSNLTSVTSRIKIPEVEQLLKFMGVNIIQIPGKSECPDPNDEDSALSVINKMTQKTPNKYIHKNQYTNINNTLIHKNTTANEIFNDLYEIDYFISGLGTAGSSGGIIEFIKENKKSTRVLGVVSEPSDYLPGIRTMAEMYETNLFMIKNYFKILEVSSLEALKFLRILVQKEGILAGPTTGANFAATIKFLKQNDNLRSDGNKQVAVFLACDRIESYMSYIVERMPELFDTKTNTDIFNISANENNNLFEKEASQETLKWVSDENVKIIDIRGVRPFSKFRINGSVCYPEEHLREVLIYETPFAGQVLFVCPSGERSILYAKLLRDRGVQGFSLKGGLVEWRQAGLPIERPVRL